VNFRRQKDRKRLWALVSWDWFLLNLVDRPSMVLDTAGVKEMLKINIHVVLALFLLAFTSAHASGKQAKTCTYKSGKKHQHKSVNARATRSMIPDLPLTCVFEVRGFPVSTIVYDPDARTLTTMTGSPSQTQVFTNVTTETGLAPYGEGGFSVIAFGDIPLVHINLRSECACDGKTFYKAKGATLIATWGSAPGGPRGVLNAGRCNIPYPHRALNNPGWRDNSIPCSELTRWPDLFWECQSRNSP